MNHRINITLPEVTLRRINQIVHPGERSRFIAQAVEFYANTLKKAELRRRLREGALRRAGRDRLMAEEWTGIDEESWRERAK